MKNFFLVIAVIWGASGCAIQDVLEQENVLNIQASISLSQEQQNIKKRIEEENNHNRVRYIYFFNRNGLINFESTVKGKVTSSKKRLNPNKISNKEAFLIPIRIWGAIFNTKEVKGDDQAYGTEKEFWFWWDKGGKYQKREASDIETMHVSSAPLSPPKEGGK